MAAIYEQGRHHTTRERPFDWREFHPMEAAAFARSLEDAIPEATEADLDRIFS